MDVCDFSKLLVWFFTNEKKWWTYKRIKILNHFSSETNTRELGGKLFTTKQFSTTKQFILRKSSTFFLRILKVV